jgi:hypothetical protein
MIVSCGCGVSRHSSGEDRCRAAHPALAAQPALATQPAQPAPARPAQPTSRPARLPARPRSMMESKVLVVGLGGVACEICKNLILGGVGQVTLMDHEEVRCVLLCARATCRGCRPPPPHSALPRACTAGHRSRPVVQLLHRRGQCRNERKRRSHTPPWPRRRMSSR